MSLRELIQYIELYSINGIDDLFFSSKPTLKINPISTNRIIDNITNTNLLQDLYRKNKNCRNCIYHQYRKKMVLGQGSLNAEIMVIGGPPNAEENLTGTPFIGKYGELFTTMMSTINLNREDLFITNITKCRVLNGKREDMSKCYSMLVQEINIINPKIILLFGEIAANVIFNKDETIEFYRSKKGFKIEGIPVFITIHPSSLLDDHQKLLKRLVWEDLKMFREEFLILKSKQEINDV